MHDHGWLVTCAVLLVTPVTAVAQQTSADAERADAMERRLRKLEAKYEKTGEPEYLFERALTLEDMGEYQFALQIIENHREDFEAASSVDGVAVVEQRLRRRISEEPSENEGGDSTAARGGVDLLGWTLTGVGSAVLTAGTVSVWVAERRARRLRCSAASEGSAAEGCDGVDPYAGLSPSEFDAKRKGVRVRRAVGLGLGAAGVGLATWGIVRLASVRGRTRAARTSPGVDPSIVWNTNGARVGFRIAF